MTPERTINPGDNRDSSEVQRVNRYPKGNLFKRLFRIELRAEAVVNLDDVVGEIDPRLYGQFMADPDACGWAGRELGEEVVELCQTLQPAIIRFKVGLFRQRFSSGGTESFFGLL